MPDASFCLDAIASARNELLLFAGVGLLVGALDDIAVDLIYGVRRVWRALTVYSRYPRMTADQLPPYRLAGTLAVMIPAWDEGDVIGAMLRHCLAAWGDGDYHLFVGTYPNDVGTIAAVADVAANSDRVTIVVGERPGPTTKADCLNAIWHAIERWEAARGSPAKAIVLHDAEDVVHPDAIRVLQAMVERFALVQLPVLPLTSRHSRWISGHYCDEFAESHAKALLVREALGAALPSAGVGCAVARAAIGALAEARGGRPFDPDSLTEDYELGLKVGEWGGRGVLIRMRGADGSLVATREYFPETLGDAVRQKARWTVGIALAGWDRMGWGATIAETWMRLRDRRALLAAIILLAAYAGILLTAPLTLGAYWGFFAPRPLSPGVSTLIEVNGLFLLWRVVIRALFVGRAYGWAEAARSAPRLVVANIIAMMAARRALMIYLRLWGGAVLRWDKTAHRFPGTGQEAA